jgi:alpha-beta hydrolase superfamily lysophospholipase
MTFRRLSFKSKRSVPLYLMGYSAGATTLLTFLQMYPRVQKYIAGVIIIAPALQVDQTARQWLLDHPMLGKLMDYCEHHNSTAVLLDYALDVVSRFYPDVLVGKLEETDPNDKLEYKKGIDLRTAIVLHLAAKRARRKMPRINVPIFFLHGAKDPIAAVGATIEAFESVGTPPEQKTIKIYENGDHHIIHRSVPDIIEWLEQEHKRASYEKIVYEEGLLMDMVGVTAVLFFLSKNIWESFRHAFTQLWTIFRNMFTRWVRKLQFWK